jgi:hypothetical protein
VISVEAVAEGDQLGAQLGEIIDLPVEYDDKVAVGGGHGLVASRDIEDGQPAVAKMDAPDGVRPITRVVRAAVRERIGHAPEVGIVSRADKSRYAAHG